MDRRCVVCVCVSLFLYLFKACIFYYTQYEQSLDNFIMLVKQFIILLGIYKTICSAMLPVSWIDGINLGITKDQISSRAIRMERCLLAQLLPQSSLDRKL